MINTFSGSVLEKPSKTVILINPNYFYSMGLLSIGTYLRQFGYKIHLLDGDISEIIQCAISLKGEEPLFIGISAATSVVEFAYSIAQKLKPQFPHTKFIIGGYHATAEPARTLRESMFDIAVIGEGELTIREIAENLLNNKYPTYSPGCFEKHGNQIIENSRRSLIKKLSEIPMYDFSLLKKPIVNYFCDAIRDKKGLATTSGRGLFLLFSRGCPYDCVFCASFSNWEHKFRFYDTEIIINQIEHLLDTYKLDSITFLDDEIVSNKKFLSSFCQGIISRNINKRIKWECHSRGKSLTPEAVQLLKEAGCILVRIGVESGSNKILHFLKGQTISVEDNFAAIQLCKKMGMRTFGSFIIGSPDEGQDDIIQTINFITKSGLNSASVFVAVPYPGTELAKICKERNLMREGISWSDYRVEYANGVVPLPIIRNQYFSSKQLYEIARYINNMIVKPLNLGFTIPPRDYLSDIKEVLEGNTRIGNGFLRCNVYDKFMVLHKKIEKKVRLISNNPKNILPIMKKILMK